MFIDGQNLGLWKKILLEIVKKENYFVVVENIFKGQGYVFNSIKNNNLKNYNIKILLT